MFRRCVLELRDFFHENPESEKIKRSICGYQNTVLTHWMCSRLPDMLPASFVSQITHDKHLLLVEERIRYTGLARKSK